MDELENLVGLSIKYSGYSNRNSGYCNSFTTHKVLKINQNLFSVWIHNFTTQ